MTGRQDWRLAFSLFVCCWCGMAAAQERELPRRGSVLINDLPGAAAPARLVVPLSDVPEAVLGAPVDSPFELFCERLDGELSFVARACQLTPEERQAVAAVRDEIVGQFKPLLQRQAAGQAPGAAVQRMAAVNGQVVVLDARGAAQVLIPDRIIRAQVDLAVNAALSKERLATLEGERQRMERKSRWGRVLALAAAVDEAMLMSDEQFARLCDYLADNWRPVWAQVSAGPFLAYGATPLQTAKARGLGGVFDLFDAALEPLLRPAQMAAWREMRTLHIEAQAPIVVPPNRLLWNNRQIQVRGARAARIVRPANGALLVIQAGAAAPVAVPIQPAPAAGGRPLAEGERAAPGQPPIVEPPRELAMLLELLVEDAALTAELSKDQRETLLLAGKLDIQRYRAEREAELRERFEQVDEAPGNEKPRVQTETVAASNPFSSPNSRFRKALASRLSNEQLQRLAQVERKRCELRREAVVQTFVRDFDERMKLTADQWDALADAFRQRLPPVAGDHAEPDAISDAAACIEHVSSAELRGHFDESQWPAAEQILNELKQAAAHFRRKQAIVEISF